MFVTVTSNPKNKGADYFCDGIHDEVQINEAIKRVKVAGGGDVFLDGWLFNIQGPIKLEPDVVRLVGSGWKKHDE